MWVRERLGAERVSERRACQVLGQVRSTQRRERQIPDDEARWVARMVELATQYGRYGYRRVTAILHGEGWKVNPKRVERLWRQEGLKVPSRQPKRRRLWLNDGSGVLVQHVPGDRAYYRIDEDQVVLPEPSQFITRNGYYQTALHECGHSTGHPDRMGRDTLKKGLAEGFGSPGYAREELRAEISAMMTGERVGVGHDPAAWSRLRRELGEGARRRPKRDSPSCC